MLNCYVLYLSGALVNICMDAAEGRSRDCRCGAEFILIVAVLASPVRGSHKL